ncbi:sulfatase/phosphatase domain-containing protein [Nonomuraea sp. 3N208]|uniref:sulfatase/phosphatase domain-containing protein n=1 Tax=Nonomuraea sp. 3N208 TaxID=3457421 RepID=UPI003FCE2680
MPSLLSSEKYEMPGTGRHEELKGLGLVDPGWRISPRDADSPPWDDAPHRDWEDRRMATYAAQITCMDRGIGNIPGLPCGPGDTFMSYGRSWANAGNSPFRRFKRWVHEGGISTPFIVSWPARIARPGIVHEPAHFIDIFATCLDAAGAAYPTEFGGHEITPLEPQVTRMAAMYGAWARRSGAQPWEIISRRQLMTPGRPPLPGAKDPQTPVRPRSIRLTSSVGPH